MKLGVFRPIVHRTDRLDHSAHGTDVPMHRGGQLGLFRRTPLRRLPKSTIQQLFTGLPKLPGLCNA
jgi:hypothetical protein